MRRNHSAAAKAQTAPAAVRSDKAPADLPAQSGLYPNQIHTWNLQDKADQILSPARRSEAAKEMSRSCTSSAVRQKLHTKSGGLAMARDF